MFFTETENLLKVLAHIQVLTKAERILFLKVRKGKKKQRKEVDQEASNICMYIGMATLLWS